MSLRVDSVFSALEIYSFAFPAGRIGLASRYEYSIARYGNVSSLRYSLSCVRACMRAHARCESRFLWTGGKSRIAAFTKSTTRAPRYVNNIGASVQIRLHWRRQRSDAKPNAPAANTRVTAEVKILLEIALPVLQRAPPSGRAYLLARSLACVMHDRFSTPRIYNGDSLISPIRLWLVSLLNGPL